MIGSSKINHPITVWFRPKVLYVLKRDIIFLLINFKACDKPTLSLLIERSPRLLRAMLVGELVRSLSFETFGIDFKFETVVFLQSETRTG